MICVDVRIEGELEIEAQFPHKLRVSGCRLQNRVDDDGRAGCRVRQQIGVCAGFFLEKLSEQHSSDR